MLWRKHQLLERVVGDTLHLSAFLWAVLSVIGSHASSSLFMGCTHTYPSFSSPGVKQAHALWLKSSLIYFACSNWISPCWYVLNKNSRIIFLIIPPPHIFSHRTCILHRGFVAITFFIQLGPWTTHWLGRPNGSCRSAALCWQNCEPPTVLTWTNSGTQIRPVHTDVQMHP